MTRPLSRHYEPRGAAREIFRRRDPEIVLSGPAGTGKSVACLWKLHYLCTIRPNVRALILRKTRASLTDSALVTFERDVLPETHPARGGAHRSGRHSYHYPNGSEIVTGGMDRPTKVMSTDYDLIYVQEAIELAEDEWEALTTRLRNGALPFQQLLADTNPDSPRHWLKRRAEAGKCAMLESRHEDNASLWDPARGAWTLRGQAYMDRLDALTGPRKQRLRFGRWVQAEGVVYEGWDPALHRINRAKIPADWPRLWSIDFGFTNPFCWQAWAVDPDDRLIRYREIYRTRTLVEDHAKRILELTRGEPLPVAVICDHDAEDRATLERYLGLPTTAADKRRSPGFQAVAERLRKQKDGKARLYFMRDCGDGRDEDLDARKLPCSTEEEFDCYTWRDHASKEEPVKEHDHGMDCLRYLVWTLDNTDATIGNDHTVLRA